MAQIAPAWKGTRHLSPRCACCRTGGLRRALGTKPSGCGTSKPAHQTARLEGHSNSVTALCVLPDGRLASGSEDKTIRLWDVKTGAETARLGGTLGSVRSAVRAAGRATRLRLRRQHHPAVGRQNRRRDRPPGGTLVNCRCALRAAGRAARVGLFGQHNPAVGRQNRHPDRPPGKALVNCRRAVRPAGRAACVRLFRQHHPAVGREQPAAETRAPGRALVDYVAALCVLPDGRLASGSWDKTIRLWDVYTGAETARLEGHSNSVTALCALPDGRLASGSWDKTIRLWDVLFRRRDCPPRGTLAFGHCAVRATRRAARLELC